MKRKIIAMLLILLMFILPYRSIAVAVSSETAPACSCGNAMEDLSTHADGCDRKAFCRNISNKTAQELYDTWSQFPFDVQDFVLTYLSWTNYNKHQALSELLKDFTDRLEPELPSEEEKKGCQCDVKSTYGSLLHDTSCPYHFVKLSIEDEYVVYVTMSSNEQSLALSLLDESERAELKAYIAEHPYAHTVSEDGISVTACDVPVGATVTATVVDKEFTENLLPSLTMASQVDLSLDIKVYSSNGTVWEPSDGESVMVKIALPETTLGQKSDIVHILDSSSAIEKAIANKNVKFKDISAWFFGEDENGNVINITPEMPDVYWKALESAEKLGYKKQLAYEILTGTCVDDGYSVFYTDSFSAFSNGSLVNGYTYYIKWDLTGDDGDGKWLGDFRGYYTSKPTDKDDLNNIQRHQYYYDSIGNVKVPTGATVNFVFVKGSVPVSGTITVEGTLNVSLYNGTNIPFYKYKNNIGGNPTNWREEQNKTLSMNQLYYDANNTIYRASGNTGTLISVEKNGTLNLVGQNNGTPFIIDGKSITGNGAAIYSTGRVNLDYVTIQNNYKSSSGAGIIIDGSSSNTLDYVNFNNCSATNNGGAVQLASSASCTMNSVSINKCSARNGGGIYKSSSGSLTLNSSTIKDCSSNGLYLGGAGANTITSCTVSGCTAADGAALLIVSTAGSTTVNTSTITGNNGLNGELGGTIRSYGTTVSTVTFNNCNIYGNSSPQHGGGFYWNAGGSSKLTINNCNIYNNSAGSMGGGIFCESVMEIKGTTNIYGNSATKGGGICVNGYEGTATATNGGSDLSLSNSISIYNNTATENGGGISMNVRKSVSLYDDAVFIIRLNGASIYGNTAASGGGIHIFRNSNGSTYSCAVDLNYGKFENNTATSGNGGGVYTENVNVTIGNTSGTAMTVTGNKAAKGIGGAIYSTGSLGSCNITNGNIVSNSAQYGGAIAVDNEKATINGGSITSNTASIFGGAIYATGVNAGVTVSGDGTISSNSAANGGGIYATAGADVSVTGGIISFNTAKGSPAVTTAYSDGATSGVGGGIYVGNGTSANSSSITFSGSSVGLYGNTADFAAADAYASGSYTLVTLPVVKNMNLTGYSGAATGWFEDYATDDTGYEYSLKNGTFGERYSKARNAHEITSAANITKYTAITLGISKTGYGNLTIKKSGSNISENQTFIFEISGNNLSMTVSVVGADSITIYDLPDGAYTVTEITTWSWRYTPETNSINTTISATNVNPVLTFNNTLTNNDWLSATDSKINVKG